jgi:hypothetical protein
MMNKVKKSMAVLGIIVAIGFTGFGVANAMSVGEPAGGGDWTHNVDVTVWSHYTHQSIYHGSSAYNGAGLGSCVDARAGQMSNAWVTPPTPWGNSTYWHHGSCNG